MQYAIIITNAFKRQFKVILENERLDTSQIQSVKFYDISDSQEGQFVSSYYANTLKEHYGALSLCGDIKEWTVSAKNMVEVRAFIENPYSHRTKEIKKKEYVNLPEEIVNAINAWRYGIGIFPETYINFHKQLADKELERMKSAGFTIHNTWMKPDGNGDGMKLLYAVVEDKKENCYKIHWESFNQGFMVRSSSGGSLSFDWED